MEELFLGVDGGQSSTSVLIADRGGRVVGSASGGPCNHVGAAEGREKFVRVISESLAAASSVAGLDYRAIKFAGACLGFSGGPDDKRQILEGLLRGSNLSVTTDALIALSGATGGEPGIITIAGTGSIAYGRNARGETARAGGWGYLFGDEGGAFDIVRRALRAVLREAEGWGPATALSAVLLQATGTQSANELMHAFYTAEYPRARVAAFAPLVDEAAQQGDEAAREILLQAAAELANLARAVHRQIFAPDQPVLAAYIGGVFRSTILLDRFKELVHRELAGSCAEPPLYGPAAGALIEAYRTAGFAPPRLSNLPPFKT